MFASSRRLHRIVALAGLGTVLLAAGSAPTLLAQQNPEAWVLVGLGDSLTHGTMDATNNAINTSRAYLQLIRNSLVERIQVIFSQPFLDENGDRLAPYRIPTNVAIDGEDSFSIDGLDYYRRAGTTVSLPSDSLIADQQQPADFADTHDTILFPVNLLAGPVSQMGAAEWLLAQGIPGAGLNKAIVAYWVGNNDSSLAALGSGGSNPMFLPIPVDQLLPVLPALTTLLKLGEALGELSFEPYTPEAIDRNLTSIEDFAAQQTQLLARLNGAAGSLDHHIFVLTLPYYSAVGYLMDSDDLEYYLQKVNPAYTVPASFKRVALPGQPIVNPLQGDRVSLLTFGLMYALLDSGLPVPFVNGALEINGVQRDGLVLSEAEVAQIMSRIDAFNGTLRSLAASAGPNVHLVDVGQYLSDVLTGEIDLVIAGHEISRKWMRGSAFTFDGVHPGYTGQALIANFVLAQINQELGIDAPMKPLTLVAATDPYIDRDGDGFAAGPTYPASGIGEVLFLFKDPDDANAAIEPVLPEDVWALIAKALLSDILRSSEALRPEARRLGLQ